MAPEVHEHTEATGMKAYMAQEVHEHTESTGMTAYVASEVHEVRRSVTSQNIARDIEYSGSSQLPDSSQADGRSTRCGGSQGGLGSSATCRWREKYACSKMVSSRSALDQQIQDVLGSPSNPAGPEGRSRPFGPGVGPPGGLCGSASWARGPVRPDIMASPGSCDPEILYAREDLALSTKVQEERLYAEEPEKFEDTDTMEYLRQALSLAEERQDEGEMYFARLHLLR